MTAPTRKRKGPTISLISGTNGRPTREHAGKAFSCHHCDGAFAKGDPYVAIPQRTGAHTHLLRVCDSCFKPILEKTSADVEALRGL
jgi:hypothetical protein